MVDMACPRWQNILGRCRPCWADVGLLADMFSPLLRTFHDVSLWWYCKLLSVDLCTHISMFCFICSLTIILCVIKTVQTTPLAISEPGRYKYDSETVSTTGASRLIHRIGTFERGPSHLISGSVRILSQNSSVS